MEQKLISKECVPDNEVWVSPKTWEAPFGLKVNESQNKADNSASTPCGECKWNSINNLQCDACCHAFHSQFAQRT